MSFSEMYQFDCDTFWPVAIYYMQWVVPLQTFPSNMDIEESDKELKSVEFVRFTFARTQIAWSELTVVARGTRDDERVGNKIRVKRIRLRVTTEYEASAGSSGQPGATIRFIIALWVNQNRDNAGTNNPNILHTSNNVWSFQNPVTEGEVEIIHEEHLIINCGTMRGSSASNPNDNQEFREYDIPCDIIVGYTDGSGVITPETNGIIWGVQSDKDNQVRQNWASQILFEDL